MTHQIFKGIVNHYTWVIIFDDSTNRNPYRIIKRNSGRQRTVVRYQELSCCLWFLWQLSLGKPEEYLTAGYKTH